MRKDRRGRLGTALRLTTVLLGLTGCKITLTDPTVALRVHGTVTTADGAPVALADVTVDEENTGDSAICRSGFFQCGGQVGEQLTKADGTFDITLQIQCPANPSVRDQFVVNAFAAGVNVGPATFECQDGNPPPVNFVVPTPG